MNLDGHNRMVHDRIRVRPYARAIRKMVRPGDVVIDLGAGTGLLGFLALQAGAKRVHMIDEEPILHAARMLARDLGFEERITWHPKHSSRVRIPEKADLLVTETIGHFSLDEKMLESVADARRRLLKPRARIIPQTIETVVRAVSLPGIYSKWIEWRGPVEGLSYRSLKALSIHQPRMLPRWPRGFLSAPERFCRYSLPDIRKNPLPCEEKTNLTINRKGVLHGLLASFSSLLAPGVTLQSGPRTSWFPFYFPMKDPLEVLPRDRVTFSLRIESDLQYTWSWRIRRGRREIARSNHSTLLLHPRALSSL